MVGRNQDDHGIKHGRELQILAEVVTAVKKWPRYAGEAGITVKQRDAIANTLHLHFGSGRTHAKRAKKAGT